MGFIVNYSSQPSHGRLEKGKLSKKKRNAASKKFLLVSKFALSNCIQFLKNQVGKSSSNVLEIQSILICIFTACVACKNQFPNWFLQVKNPVHPTWFFKLDFSKIKYRWLGHWVSRIKLCKGQKCGSTYIVVWQP